MQEDNENLIPKGITVSQLNRYIKGIIEKDVRLCRVTVLGEISNFKKHFSGHCYMTVKDEASMIKAVMFKSAADKLKFEPENGMKVILFGHVSVYERDGQYQLYIDSMQKQGVGDLYAAFEKLKEKLAKEGLFDESKKKPIPKFPRRVGVVTSPTGAAVRDIINVMTRRFPMCEIMIYPVLVQGEGGAEQVCEAIKYFNQEKNVDVIIAGRGGGSIEELWVFNEEKVARAIAECELPIISAVGHQTDFTIADFVADLRAPTPSAAAELAVPSTAELRARVSNYHSRALFAVNKAIEARRAVLKSFTVRSPLDIVAVLRQRVDGDYARLVFAVNKAVEMRRTELRRFVVRSPLDNITALRQRVGATYQRLCGAFSNKSVTKRNSLALLAGRLDALSPLAVLKRGYTLSLDGQGRAITSVSQVREGDGMVTRVADGEIKSVVV